MSPTREEHLLFLNSEIKKLDCRLAGYQDNMLRGERHWPSFNRTIEQRQRLIAERDRVQEILRVSDKTGLKQEGNPTNKRKSFVQPILDKKGWSILDWANHSGLAYKTAANYLKGKTKPYKSTLTKLAKPLDVDVQSLPS